LKRKKNKNSKNEKKTDKKVFFIYYFGLAELLYFCYIKNIIMPIMDGMSMLVKLREDNWGKNVPVVILTNLSDTEKIAESMEKKAFDYLIKTDWTLDDIVKKVKEKLEI